MINNRAVSKILRDWLKNVISLLCGNWLASFGKFVWFYFFLFAMKKVAGDYAYRNWENPLPLVFSDSPAQ